MPFVTKDFYCVDMLINILLAYAIGINRQPIDAFLATHNNQYWARKRFLDAQRDATRRNQPFSKLFYLGFLGWQGGRETQP